MNHKWRNNICVKCGLNREIRGYKQAGLPYSVLGRDGCWHDKIPYTYGTTWHYGDQHRFKRPDCKMIISEQGVQECDANGMIREQNPDNKKQNVGNKK